MSAKTVFRAVRSSPAARQVLVGMLALLAADPSLSVRTAAATATAAVAEAAQERQAELEAYGERTTLSDIAEGALVVVQCMSDDRRIARTIRPRKSWQYAPP